MTLKNLSVNRRKLFALGSATPTKVVRLYFSLLLTFLVLSHQKENPHRAVVIVDGVKETTTSVV